MRYGLIVDDVVVQVQPAPAGEGAWVELPEGVTNGCRRHGGEWTAPPSSDYAWDAESGSWVLTPEAQARAARMAALAYRIARKEAYREVLGKEPENGYIDTLGDCLDVFCKEFDRRRTAGEVLHAELDQMLDDWLAVKAANPKPD